MLYVEINNAVIYFKILNKPAEDALQQTAFIQMTT